MATLKMGIFCVPEDPPPPAKPSDSSLVWREDTIDNKVEYVKGDRWCYSSHVDKAGNEFV
ncbi:hypothetical protein A2U01_0044319 [Trifolium medium]|uniref:Uncharacterized protein n=1 Tax=Trifolium medium TaxID=97028 RepID=A0A392QFH5_9FABA|nr:hypothetical protein [Trifolium medium]